MNFTIQGRYSVVTLSEAKGDNTVPMLVVKINNRPLRTSQHIAHNSRITAHEFLCAHDFFPFQLQALH